MRQIQRLVLLAIFLLTHTALSAAAPASESLFHIDDAWITGDGKPFRLIDLKGSPSVVAMIYTSCKDVCPLIVEDMKKIEKLLPTPQSEKVRFVLFSFDSARDSTEKIKGFSKSHGIDSPRWLIARSTDGAIRRLAVALGIKYKKTKSGDFEHSNLISILDNAGLIKHQQLGLGQSGEEAALVIKNMMK